MARFKFKLEVVLKQRKREEQDKQRELAVRLAKVNELEAELRRLDESVKSAAEDLRQNHLTGAINLSFLAAHRRFLGSMQRQGLNIAQKIAVAQLHVEEARKHLAEAAKRRKAIEKLRERKLELWRADQSRREMIDTDEIGTQIAVANLAAMNFAAADLES